MALEIERKFLVAGEFRDRSFKRAALAQGYLCADPDRTVRVRIADDRGFITVKGRNDGAVRFEWEKEIPVDEARQLLSLCRENIIEKTRYYIKGDGHHVWEVDEFHGRHEGLVVAEIELSDENENFLRPDWLGEEVTFDPRYYNSNLSKI